RKWTEQASGDTVTSYFTRTRGKGYECVAHSLDFRKSLGWNHHVIQFECSIDLYASRPGRNNLLEVLPRAACIQQDYPYRCNANHSVNDGLNAYYPVYATS